MGVSVKDDRVDNRIYDLRQVPAHVRFLSCEQLIGPTEGLPLEGIHWVDYGRRVSSWSETYEKEMGMFD